MENHIQNIELINNYLNKTLSDEESKAFENRLKTDEAFKALFDEHIVVIEGVKRHVLKAEITKGKQLHVRNKWMKYIGLISGILIVLGIIYLNSKSSNVESSNESLDQKDRSEIVVDSITPNKNEKSVFKDSIVLEKRKEKPIVQKKEKKKAIVNVEIPRKLSQEFTINSTKDEVVICKEGTKLEIKASAFITSSNKPVEGAIKLNITEYYKFSDILLANLTTVSNGKQLETGGMLFVEASKNGERLKLKPNSTIQITFPEKNKKEGMKLFSGAWIDGNINWTLQSDEIITDELVIEDIEIEELDVVVPFSIVENVPVFPGCEQGNNNENRKCTSEKISAFVNRKFRTEFENEIGLSGKQRINVIFTIDKTGNVTKIRARANHPKLEEEAIRVFSLLPKMTPGIQGGKTVSVPYSLPIIFQVEGSSNVTFNRTNNSRVTTSKINASAIKKFEEKIVGKESDEVSVSDVNGYVFRAYQLGYINCDRFIRNRSRIKYKIKIKNSEDAIVNMVFKNIRSVMPGWKNNEEYDFRQVPEGEDVVLVAIKKYDGKLYFDTLETETVENPNLKFNFKLVTLENLKNELKKLDQ